MKAEPCLSRTGLRYQYPVYAAVKCALLLAPGLLIAWIAAMALLAGWRAAVILAVPIALPAVPAIIVLRRLYVRWTCLGPECRRLLEIRPKGIDYTSRKLGPYPYPYEKTAPHRDEEAIVEWRYPGRAPLRATTIISQYALTLWGKLCYKDDPDIRADFLRHADALVARQTLGDPHDGCWLQEHKQDYYWPHEVPYASAMCQAQGISVLLRAHQITGHERYLQACQRAMLIFEKSVAGGGVRSDYPDGKVFFEEYCLSPFYSHTLNGLIYTLIGLEEMARVTDHPRARHWYERGVETLARPQVLDRYDLGYASTYDQLPSRLLAYDYHAVHCCLLMCLFDMTGREVFKETAERWLAYTDDRACRVRLFVHILSAKGVSGAWRTRLDP